VAPVVFRNEGDGGHSEKQAAAVAREAGVNRRPARLVRRSA
jgi:hypothetical protein